MSEHKSLEQVVQDHGLPTTKAREIVNNFSDLFEQADRWEQAAREIRVTDESQKHLMAAARTLRLEIRERRLAVESKRKELKEDALREGKAIDGIANVLKAIMQPLEKYLDEQEHFAELREQERAEQRRLAAEQALREKEEAEEAERQRQAEEERQRQIAEAKAAQEAAEKRAEEEAAARREEQKKAEAERQEWLKAEAERKEREAAERQKREKEEADRLRKEEREREAEKKKREKAEAERAAREKAEREELERKHAEELEAAAAKAARVTCPKCGHSFDSRKHKGGKK